MLEDLTTAIERYRAARGTDQAGAAYLRLRDAAAAKRVRESERAR